MKSIVRVVLALCAALAGPVLGYWEYDGTTVSIGEPDSGSDPYGTWSWWYDGSGDVDYDIDFIDASGDLWGGAAIQLYTDYGLGLQRSTYAENWVYGTSDYHWEDGGGDPNIAVTYYVNIYSYFDYYGYALNYFGNSPVTCSPEAYTEGGGECPLFAYYPGGYGGGTANSEGGSTAENSWYEIEPTTDDWDADQPSSSEGTCSGVQELSGEAEFGPYEGDPMVESFSATARLLGIAYVQGRIVINGSPHFGGFNAGAGYEISGTGTIELDGDIRDLD